MLITDLKGHLAKYPGLLENLGQRLPTVCPESLEHWPQAQVLFIYPLYR